MKAFKKIEKTIKIGTKIKLIGDNKIYSVKDILHNNRFVKVENLHGLFQRDDIQSYTNK